jgi:hypothetical protein
VLSVRIKYGRLNVHALVFTTGTSAINETIGGSSGESTDFNGNTGEKP